MSNFFEDFFNNKIFMNNEVEKTVIVCEGCGKKIRIKYGATQRCPHCKTIIDIIEVNKIFDGE